RQARVQQVQDPVQFDKNNHQLQLGLTHVALQDAMRLYGMAPKSVQEAIDQRELELAEKFKIEGIYPLSDSKNLSYDDMVQHMQTRMDMDGKDALKLIPLRNAKGTYDIYRVANPDAPLMHDAPLPTYGIDGKQSGEIMVKAGTMSISEYTRRLVDGETKTLDREVKKYAVDKKAAAAAGNGAGASTIDGLAQSVIDGKVAPSQIAAKQRGLVLDRIHKLQPDFDAIDAEASYQAKKGVAKDFTSGKAAQTLTAFNTASGHLAQLDSLVDALNNGDTQVINKIGNEWARSTGGVAPTNFDAVKKAVAGEVSKAFTGNVATDSEIAHISEAIDSAQSPAQLHGAIGQFRGLLGSKKAALQAQYEQG